MLRFIPSATIPDIVRLPLFTERCAAGFPSPALFPYVSGCQSQLPVSKSIYFSLLRFRRVCNQSLTKLTIVRGLKALNSNGALTRLSRWSFTCNCSFVPFVPFVAKKE